MAYVDTFEVYKALTAYYKHTTGTQHAALLEALRRVPTAEVVERKKGKWVEADLDRDFVTCSICKNAGYKDRMAWRPNFAKKYFNFCPNCGAKMKRRMNK